MHYKVLYRLFVLSISLLMPLTNLHAAPVPESAVVEISESQQIFEQAKAYHDGQGVLQDLSKAFTLYTNAAQLGNVDAKVNLGYMLFMGEGCEQNYYEARTWYSQAAAAGDASHSLAIPFIRLLLLTTAGSPIFSSGVFPLLHTQVLTQDDSKRRNREDDD